MSRAARSSCAYFFSHVEATVILDIEAIAPSSLRVAHRLYAIVIDLLLTMHIGDHIAEFFGAGRVLVAPESRVPSTPSIFLKVAAPPVGDAVTNLFGFENFLAAIHCPNDLCLSNGGWIRIEQILVNQDQICRLARLNGADTVFSTDCAGRIDCVGV